MGVKKWTTAHDVTMMEHLLQGLDDQSIANLMGFAESTITTRREAKGWKRNHRPANNSGPKSKPIPMPREKPNPKAMIEQHYGSAALVERNGGYWLNGVPIAFIELVKRANRTRIKDKLEPIGPPHWHS